MKKLLIVAAFLVTGIAFSQTQNVQDSNGKDDVIGKTIKSTTHAENLTNSNRPACADCEVEQATRPEGFITMGKNKVDIQQVGDNNQAKGYQTGNSNMSLIRQDNTSGGVAPATGNLASTHQNGHENGADIKQFGDENRGRIYQRGNGNYAKQDVGDDTAKNAENNEAYAFQVGDGNTASQTQRYDNNQASSYQWGDNNSVVQNQSSGPNGSEGSEAFANQVGEDNAIEQNQTGSHNYASAYQTGNGNSSNETQTMIGGSEEYCNISTVNQVGDDNKSCVTQDADMGNNCSLVNQIGNDNSSVVNQTANPGGNNASCVLQRGDMNKAQVIQTGPGSI